MYSTPTLKYTAETTISTTSIQPTTAKISTTTMEPEFQCKFYPIPMKFRCDGIPHCAPDHEDEKGCPEGKNLLLFDKSW